MALKFLPRFKGSTRVWGTNQGPVLITVQKRQDRNWRRCKIIHFAKNLSKHINIFLLSKIFKYVHNFSAGQEAFKLECALETRDGWDYTKQNSPPKKGKEGGILSNIFFACSKITESLRKNRQSICTYVSVCVSVCICMYVCYVCVHVRACVHDCVFVFSILCVCVLRVCESVGFFWRENG